MELTKRQKVEYLMASTDWNALKVGHVILFWDALRSFPDSFPCIGDLFERLVLISCSVAKDSLKMFGNSQRFFWCSSALDNSSTFAG